MKRLLKKYKDKLYTFLVLKNSAIASEYQAYVTADTERHEKHRLKSWIYLLKLNWIYRILRGKPAKKPGNKPYADGPESELSNRPLQIHLATKLLEYDVISFDIFDTLILRPLNNPKDVFYFVGLELGIMNFRSERIKAEVEARQANFKINGSLEVTIYDIYSRLYKNGIIDNIDQGISTEFKIEMELCRPNPYFYDVYTILCDKNKILYVTSDMYFPKDMIEKLLIKCGYTAFKNILVSCDQQKSKAEGTIYNIIKESHIDKKIIHIGDNYTSDITNAQKYGIDTFFYKNVNNIGNQYRAYTLTPIIKSAYSGTINNILHADNNTRSFMYEFGLLYGGILVMGYAEYIKRLYKKLSIDQILFISRDGYLLNKYAKEYWDKNINYSYFYFSRTIALKVCAHMDYKYFIDTIFSDSNVNRSNSGYIITIKKLFQIFELDEMIKKLEEVNIKADDLVNDDNKMQLFDVLVENKSFVLSKFEKSKQYYIQYVKSVIKNNKNILLVDVGWSGKSISLISKLIEKELNIKCTASLLGMLSRERSEYLITEQIHTYSYSATKNMFFIEQFNIICRTMTEILFSSPEPTIKEITNQFKFGTYEIENKQYNQDIVKGVFDFIKYYNDAFGQYSFMYQNIPGKDAIEPIKFFSNNIHLFTTFFESYVYNITTIQQDNAPITKPIFSYYQFKDFI